MKIAYFDCISGISGDMTLAAFIDAGLEPGVLTQLPQKLKLPHVQIIIKDVMKSGIAAKKVDIEFPHEHVHRHLHHIQKIVDEADISSQAKSLAMQMFTKLAESEARVHGTNKEKVHFHEVGALDSIFDIVGTAVAFDTLGIEAAYVGRLAVGGGTVKCAHGLMPVPAPATSFLLEDFHIQPGPVEKELVTPTGAVILATLTKQVEHPPAYKLIKSGFGAGTFDHEKVPNVMRITLGETATQTSQEQITVLECQIDDMNPEILPHVIDRLLTAGAFDAYLTPILMKKGRPGYLLSVLSEVGREAELEQIIFLETSTIGVRRTNYTRTILPRESVEIDTSLGKATYKKVTLPNNNIRLTPEFESCKNLAKANQLSLQEVYNMLANESTNEAL